MENRSGHKISELKNRISFLERREQKLRKIANSTLYSRELRDAAKNELSLVLSEASSAVTELERLKATDEPR